MSNLQWTLRRFEELGREELYEILSLRSAVFVVEQDSIYQDPDDLDQQSIHVGGYEQGRLVCYARITAPGTRFPDPSIGRVLTVKERRGAGLGEQLMGVAIAETQRRYPDSPITISAQCYLEPFYRSLRFEPVSEPYDEDGIPHIEMRLPPASASQD